VQVVEAGHPVPDRAGLRAAERLLNLIAPLTKSDLLIVLLSGGASSLLPAPVPPVSLSDKQRTTRLLLNSGANIQEINTVRKHLSLIKGGRLAASTQATIITLLLSDVLGDDPASIGSGPTVPDPSTYREAVLTLERYRLWDRVPRTVRTHLLRGRRGVIPETPKPGSARFRQVQHEIVGNNLSALTAVTAAARQAGLRTVLLSTALEGEARQAALKFAALARRIASNSDVIKPPCCIVAGGETTVTVRGKGTGGRAQEFATAAATGIVGLPHVWVAAFGTDGTDGPTDAAGAVVSGSTLAGAARRGLDVRRALRLHDTYPLLKALKAHIVTGPTGTNVNDLYLLLVL
jgi:glycerate-2-kinase